jgi:hypothetical protein
MEWNLYRDVIDQKIRILEEKIDLLDEKIDKLLEFNSSEDILKFREIVNEFYDSVQNIQHKMLLNENKLNNMFNEFKGIISIERGKSVARAKKIIEFVENL